MIQMLRKQTVELALPTATKAQAPIARTGRFHHFRKATPLAALIVLGVTSALATPSRASQYSITGIAPSIYSNFTTSINNSGNVVGHYYPDSFGDYSDHAFYYNGVVNDFNAALGNPPDGSYAQDLSDSNLITGYFYDGAHESHSFIYSPFRNTAQDLSGLFPLGTTDSYAESINNSGQVVGYFYSPPFSDNHAFLYSGGAVQDLNPAFPVGTIYSRAYNINNSSAIVGEYRTSGNVVHAYLYSNGTVTDLNPALGNSTEAHAVGVNNHNQVVGQFYNGTYGHAFVYSGGSATDIGNLLPAGKNNSGALGINDNGTVVGSFYSSNFSSNHAFVYSGGIAQDLNSLIDPSSNWVLKEADSINNRGQITGSGTVYGESIIFILSLRGVLGDGTIGSGGNQSNFVFNATSTANAPNAVGTLSFSSKNGTYLSNAAITTLTYSGSTATFSGTFSRGKGYAPGTFVVTIDNSAQTFSIALYKPGQLAPYFTRSGSLTSGSVSIS